ncbi:MAG: isoprenoid biosynthesis glyoxalase ElbB [Bacteroidota bacterium]
MSKKVAVVLSGCGVYDGSEIHEATLTLYFLSKQGLDYDIYAPDIAQHHVVNHLTGEVMNETRNVLAESARIARGKIYPLGEFNPGNYDAIIFPGGFGAAKNLSTFAFDGPACSVNPEVESAVKGMAERKKPIGALCIAPAVIARILGNVKVTIGQDAGTAGAIESMGGKHESTGIGGVTVDYENKLVTTPCYMLESSPAQIGEGIEKLVSAIKELI